MELEPCAGPHGTENPSEPLQNPLSQPGPCGRHKAVGRGGAGVGAPVADPSCVGGGVEVHVGPLDRVSAASGRLQTWMGTSEGAGGAAAALCIPMAADNSSLAAPFTRVNARLCKWPGYCVIALFSLYAGPGRRKRTEQCREGSQRSSRNNKAKTNRRYTCVKVGGRSDASRFAISGQQGGQCPP